MASFNPLELERIMHQSNCVQPESCVACLHAKIERLQEDFQRDLLEVHELWKTTRFMETVQWMDAYQAMLHRKVTSWIKKRDRDPRLSGKKLYDVPEAYGEKPKK